MFPIFHGNIWQLFGIIKASTFNRYIRLLWISIIRKWKFHSRFRLKLRITKQCIEVSSENKENLIYKTIITHNANENINFLRNIGMLLFSRLEFEENIIWLLWRWWFSYLEIKRGTTSVIWSIHCLVQKKKFDTFKFSSRYSMEWKRKRDREWRSYG